MAPSRRRGAGKAAAAAAAACRHWKVGDLVLAKVKGFPAWPATVSEPEKWGYSADWKKVLVYFFGTQQIAFCNPADVEAFTEEKKQSLLIKRQGKGADFVRAVQEIIDSYEKSKKQDHVDDFNSGDEVTLANGANSVGSAAHIELKDQRITSEATITGKNDPTLATDDASDVAQIGSFHDEEALGQPADHVVVSEKPIITTYASRKRSGGLRSRKHVTQKKAPSVERSRSSSQLESSRFQNFIMPSGDGNKSAGDVSTNVIQDRSSRRNKRIRKSPDASEWDDVDSSTFVSNGGSIEDNGSEIITADSDSVSLNEGSTIDSGCRLEHSETVVECLEGDVELSKGLDFQIKAVVIKKKRKPNRKRTTNEAAEPSARLETQADFVGGVHKSCQISQNACENLNERHNKEDGDEHLPLVKRARVRMGKPPSLEGEHNSISQAEEKISNDVAVTLAEERNGLCQAAERTSNEVAVNTVEQISPSKTCNDDFSTDRDSFAVKGSLDNASPSKDCTQIPGNKTQLVRVKEIQSFVCSPDGEAVLPPSKRLHRALEAMSANAAEEGLACGETSTINTLVNDSSISSVRSSSHVTIDSKERNASGEQGIDSLGNRVSAFFSSSSTILEGSNKSSLKPEICNQSIETFKSQEPCKDAFPEAEDCDDGKDLRGRDPGAYKVSTADQFRSPVHLTPNLDRRQASLRSKHGLLDELLLKDDGNSDNIEFRNFGARNTDKGLDASEQSGMCPNLTWGADEAVKVTSQNGTIVLQSSAEVTGCENTESLRSEIDDNGQANGMCEVAKDIKYDQKQREASYVSNSEDHLDDKDVLGHSSELPADGAESPARMSPPTTSICHVSTSESANFIQNSSCCSPNAHSHQRKPVCASVADDEKFESGVPQRLKSVGKWNSCTEAHAALSSFEAMLGSLTRTKESIGRATRMAIDCAKFGVSAKVVEILARNLECESGLPRRVDLFFLVDSIAQCSRVLKGDVGIYPSVIQAVLPRLLSAAAPPGSFAQENRRQCLKVLRLWLERRILPESIIRHHMRELDSLGGSSSVGAYSRRSARTERALDDPIRDMEGMLVDEYGSNSSFQLPGFCMPRMLKDEDEGSDSDGGTFEAVTPEHNSETPEEQETSPAVEKHTHILEDVDGELEMEDVAPHCEVEMSSTGGSAGIDASQNTHNKYEQRFPLPFVPPLPQDVPPSSPPLPSSPPPPPPPPPLHPPPVPPPCVMSDHYTNGVDSKLYTNLHNIQDDFRQSVAQQSIVPRINPSMSNAGHYCTPECIDHTQVQLCDTTSSFSSYPAHPVNVQHTDGPPSFHHKPYPPRPPHLPPSNQFSYVQAAQHVKSRRETPPLSHSRRFHSLHNVDGGNFYNSHERMRLAPYELDESWRSPAPPISGPRYPDKTKASYAPLPYGGPPREPTRLPHQEWSFPPRGSQHRNFIPFRPPSEGAVPVANRAPSIWRPR